MEHSVFTANFALFSLLMTILLIFMLKIPEAEWGFKKKVVSCNLDSMDDILHRCTLTKYITIVIFLYINTMKTTLDFNF